MKAVVICSGGQDSVTLLYDVRSKGFEPHVLSFDYGQRHKRELECAKEICGLLGLPHKVVKLDINDLVQGSALTSEDIEVPEGHYAEGNMKLTVVPNRNMIMLSIATGYAVSIGAKDVFFGAHAGDHEIYPDCRKEFIEALNQSTRIANYTPVTIHAPFIEIDKGDIAKLGLELGIPYEKTHTCYKGEAEACGVCGSCQERLEAFQKAGVEDPLPYKSRTLIPKAA